MDAGCRVTGIEADPERAAKRLSEAPDVVAVEPDGARIRFRLAQGAGDPASILATLIRDGLRVVHFAEEPVDLEDAFLQLTKGLVS